MSVKNRNTIKGHFETGDIPTQGQYVDFIDSTVFKNPGGQLQIIAGDVSASSLASETHITASGNISASGNFIGVSASLSMITASGNITAFGGTGSFGRLNITDFGNIFASGHITASGNISSSGTHTVASLNSTNISATGHITCSGRIQTLSHITASGNISASGYISGSNIIASEELFAEIATFSDLTSGRVVTTTTNGKLDDSTDLTFSGNTLTATSISSSNISASSTVQGLTGSFEYIEADKLIQHKGDPNTGIQFASDRIDITANNVTVAAFRTTAGSIIGNSSNPLGLSGSNIHLNGGPVTASSHISASGDLTVTGTIYPGGGGLWASPPVLLNDEDTVLGHNIHAGRTLIIRDTGGNRTYSLKAPTAPFGQPYHFIYGGATGDAQTTIIDTDANDNSIFFRGSVNHISTAENLDDVSTTAVFSNGDSNSRLTLNTIQACDIHILAYSANIWYVWGSVTSEQAPAFSDQ